MSRIVVGGTVSEIPWFSEGVLEGDEGKATIQREEGEVSKTKKTVIRRLSLNSPMIVH
jgi:hypothetical protein